MSKDTMTIEHNTSFSEPSVGIIVVTYNSVTKLGKFFDRVLKSLARLDYSNYSVCFVDNSSHDGTLRYVKRFMEMMKVPRYIIQLKRNKGLPFAYNAGALILRRMGLVDYLFFMNDDVILNSDSIRILVKTLERSYNICAAQPVIIHRDGHHEIGFDMGYTGYVQPKVASIPDTDYFEAPVLAGCALLVRSDCFFQAGMFDSDLFWGYDDVDTCWRLHMKGFKTIVVTKTFVHHFGSATLGRENPIKYYLSIRNLIHIFYKNHALRVAFLLTPILLSEIFAILVWKLVKKDKEYVKAIIKGLIDGIKYLPQSLKKNISLSKSVSLKDRLNVLSLMKLQIDFYLMANPLHQKLRKLAHIFNIVYHTR